MFNETWNSLVFQFTQRAPVWSVHGESAYVLLIGLNAEIALMFSIAGFAATKGLPADPATRIAGLPNRWFFALLWSAISVGVECVLNDLDVLVWEHRWWNAERPYLILLIGYLPFYTVCYWIHDIADRRKQVRTVVTLVALDIAALTTCGNLGWL